MHHYAKLLPLPVISFNSCDKVYKKQEVCFLFYNYRSDCHLAIVTIFHWIKMDYNKSSRLTVAERSIGILTIYYQGFLCYV